MPLKLTCPRCASGVSLHEPFPMPGDAVACTACGSSLAVSYPAGVMDALLARGKRFAAEPQRAPSVPRQELRPAERSPRPPVAPLPPPPGASRGVRSVGSAGALQDVGAPTEFDRTAIDPTAIESERGYHEIDRTVPAMRSPYGALAGNALEPEGRASGDVFQDPFAPAGHPPTSPTEAFDDMERSLDSDPGVLRDPGTDAVRKPATRNASGRKERHVKKGPALGCLGGLAGSVLGGVALCAVAGLGVAGGGYWYFSQDLPTIEVLRAYKPPTVTVVTDRNGEILGEIFEERRYVVPVEEIPEHVKHAFLAAEDANFYSHGGIDYMGIVRAMLRNASQGRMAQGASTITQQVAKNFLLTRDKKLERKVKEVILSWRIEDAYDKDHILYLYLNEIFLGSQAYGVEAASRAYFDKHVKDITIAEAAILAGLPQRPSDYSPHRHWDKAKERQEYVLDQMLAKGFIDQATHAKALAEAVVINHKGNTFLEQAPYFTEHVRRYIVEKYGEEKVLHEGLQVKTTCDLGLQRHAQTVLTKGVYDVDQRMGFRRAAIEHVDGNDAIAAKRAEHEEAMRKEWAFAQDPAGRIPLPETSIVAADTVVKGVVLEVADHHARVAVGKHEGIVPMAWSDWLYDPNPHRSWRYRNATNFRELTDTDGDGKDDTPILQKGDIVLVKIKALDTRDPAVAKNFTKTPGEGKSLLALHLWQTPEVEAAMLSMDLDSGAVRTMVGGADFTRSQFNRAVQSRRQVGSTFKPIVYAAAIDTKKITTASIVADAPLAFATDEEFVWKPANYGDDYLGNITLQKALAMSRNTCTVRVLEAVDPGMNDDVVYKFARNLGIGGPPLMTLPEDHVATPQNDLLCPWVLEKPDSTICMDRFPEKDPNLSNTAHRQQLKPGDEYWCRACDMSMGLGSASLTMEELVRAYSAFPTGGQLIQPYTIEEVRDRNGNVLESHQNTQPLQVMTPEVASIATWLLQGVVQGGTASIAAGELGMVGLGGKTGTTNDFKDAWFIGFTNDVITATWVGFDQPRSLGQSSTGGRTALPIWIDYMRVAAPKERDRAFPMRGDIEWATIDEKTGRRVSGGGRAFPFLPGTAPESTGLQAGQVSMEDLATEL